jgi:hypothetical protein
VGCCLRALTTAAITGCVHPVLARALPTSKVDRPREGILRSISLNRSSIA